MFKSFIIITWRNLVRNKVFFVINILSLAIGIACCILAGLFIMDELSFDKQNKDANRIFRIASSFVNDLGIKTGSATTAPALAVAIQKNIPDVESTVRLFPRGWGNNFYVRSNEKKFIEENICWADSTIFDVFTLPFKSGNAKTAMDNSRAIILTESIAKKYFRNADPIGQTIRIDDFEPKIVTGIIQDIPDNSHFKIDILLNLKSLDEDNRLSSMWTWTSFYTYIKIKPGSVITSIEKKIEAISKNAQAGNNNNLFTQPLNEIHLNSNLLSELRPNSDKSYIYIFGTIALFVLIIASINYVNLTTARSANRANEIGIRKLSGATKSTLMVQFLTESIIFAVIALFAALIIAQLILPSINHVIGKQLDLASFRSNSMIFIGFAFAVSVGLLAGLYPALFLSSLQPIHILKKEKLPGLKSISFRKILVIIQFTISIVLIIGTIIVDQQLNFIHYAKLGLNKENILMVNDVSYIDRSERRALKNDLLSIPGVKKVSASDGVLGGLTWTNKIRYQDLQNSQPVNFLSVDKDFMETIGIKLKEGRNFSDAHPDDTITSIILNEKAVSSLNIPSPVIGKRIVWGENSKSGQLNFLTIIGIVNDFHFASMKNEIKPFAFITRNQRQWNYAIKISGLNIGQTIGHIKSIWDKNVKSRPFQFSFLDDAYAKLYKSEMNFKTIFFCVTFIGIFIACLGLFGLSSFITQQRTKEIGIRKVLGASVPGIVGMLSKDFVRLVLISSIIAFPLAWWAMHSWLQDFVYRVEIKWWVFALAAIIALIIALVTISSQAIKAAIANPVKSLRTE